VKVSRSSCIAISFDFLVEFSDKKIYFFDLKFRTVEKELEILARRFFYKKKLLHVKASNTKK